MTAGLRIELPASVVEAIVAEVVERVRAEFDRSGDTWPEFMSVETASRYLDISAERLRKLQRAADSRSTRRRLAAVSCSAGATSIPGWERFGTRPEQLRSRFAEPRKRSRDAGLRGDARRRSEGSHRL